MKKTIGSILIMAMLASAMPAFAAQSAGNELLWSETFNDTTSEGTVSGWTIPSGTTVSTVNGLDGSKAILLNTASSRQSVEYDLGFKNYIKVGEGSDSVGKKIIFSYDVMAYADGINGTWNGMGKNYDFRVDLLNTDTMTFSGGVRTRTYNGTMNSALSQTASYGPDAWTMPDGTKCGMYLNQWYRMQSVMEITAYDSETNKYTVKSTYYIDGNQLMAYSVTDNKLTALNTPLTDTVTVSKNCNIKSIKLTLTTNNNTLAFDNMSISEYDESFIAKNSKYKNKNTTTDVFESFDSCNIGMTSDILPMTDSKAVQIKATPEDKSLLLPQLSSGTNSLTKNLGEFSLQNDKTYVLGFDIMYDSVDTGVDVKPLFAPLIKYNTNKYMDLFRYNPASGWHGIKVGEQNVVPANSKLSEKTWYKFNCLFDFKSKQITYFVNGEQLKDANGNAIVQPFADAYRDETEITSLTSVMLQYRSGNANFYIDNVRFEPYDNIVKINDKGIAAIKKFNTVSDDNVVTVLPAKNANVGVTVSAVNELGSDLPVSVILASYNSTQLADAKLMNIALKDGFEGTLATNEYVSYGEGIDKINAFVWSDMTNMVPYAAITLK